VDQESVVTLPGFTSSYPTSCNFSCSISHSFLFHKTVFNVTSILKNGEEFGLMRSSVLTLLNRTSRSRGGIAFSYSLRPGFKSRPGHKQLILWVSRISSGPSCKRTVLTSRVSPVSCSALRCAVLCNYQPVSISCHTVLTSTVSPVSCSTLRCAILCNYQPFSISCHTVLTSTVSPVSCSAVRRAILCNHPSFYILSHCTHLHSFPSILFSLRCAILCNHPSFYILSPCTHLHSFPSVLFSCALCNSL